MLNSRAGYRIDLAAFAFVADARRYPSLASRMRAG